jgi:hypothetical protein
MIANFLTTKFPVFFINEYRTSMNCPKCFKVLRVVPGTRKRLWTCGTDECKSCGHGDEPFMVNKHKSAAVNMFLCAMAMLMCGNRPKPFRPKDKAQKTDNEEEQEIGVDEDGGVSGGSGDAVEAVQAGPSSGKQKKRKVKS